MVEERINYSQNQKQYERLLDIFLKKIELVMSTQMQFTFLLIDITFTVAIALLAWAISLVFSSLVSLVYTNVNILKIITPLILSSNIIEKIAGVILFLIQSGMILFFVIFLLLEYIFIKKIGHRYQKNIVQYLGFDDLMEYTDYLNQLCLAKYEPEKWNIIADIDRDKKTINFIGIEPNK